jgi:hypothetical protein
MEDSLVPIPRGPRVPHANVSGGLAFGQLPNQLLPQSDEDNPRRVGEADFFSRRAIKLAPQDAEVARIRAEIEEHVKKLPKP